MFQLFYSMSNENTKKPARKPYTLKARARRKDDVHRRITLAAVHLHETLGPARTTMNAIAEHAGVQRATVYNHFPREIDLLDACSSHWFSENPPPDMTAWTQVENPMGRTEHALLELYDYYDRGQEMLGKVLRDAAVVPAMEEIRRRKWLPLMEQMIEVLAGGWSDTTDARELRACLAVAIDFFTWQKLARSGLPTVESARLAAGWVEASGNSRT